MSNHRTGVAYLCFATFLKGEDFLKTCKEAGNTVYLVTLKSLEHADWPRESIDEFFYLESGDNSLGNLENIMNGLAYMLRHRKVDRVIALDDFDVEKAAFVREQFRIPGMGQTTARLFRDKLAMRMKAAEAGIKVPAFSALFNDWDIQQYAENNAPPWMIKPRSEASAWGIRKVYSIEELWKVLDELGEERHSFLIEQFRPGDVYHADALSVDGKVVFCSVSRYLSPPLEVAQGGVFRSCTIDYDSEDNAAIQKETSDVMTAFGMKFSASHTEFIKCKEDGEFYFLETSSRVGGAHLAEMVEYGSGVNLWKEWAKIETATATKNTYQLPEVSKKHAGILISLSKQKYPDMSMFDDSEIVWKINKEHHVGMILCSNDGEKVMSLLNDYTDRVFQEFHANMPQSDQPS